MDKIEYAEKLIELLEKIFDALGKLASKKTLMDWVACRYNKMTVKEMEQLDYGILNESHTLITKSRKILMRVVVYTAIVVAIGSLMINRSEPSIGQIIALGTFLVLLLVTACNYYDTYREDADKFNVYSKTSKTIKKLTLYTSIYFIIGAYILMYYANVIDRSGFDKLKEQIGAGIIIVACIFTIPVAGLLIMYTSISRKSIKIQTYNPESNTGDKTEGRIVIKLKNGNSIDIDTTFIEVRLNDLGNNSIETVDANGIHKVYEASSINYIQNFNRQIKFNSNKGKWE